MSNGSCVTMTKDILEIYYEKEYVQNSKPRLCFARGRFLQQTRVLESRKSSFQLLVCHTPIPNTMECDSFIKGIHWHSCIIEPPGVFYLRAPKAIKIIWNARDEKSKVFRQWITVSSLTDQHSTKVRYFRPITRNVQAHIDWKRSCILNVCLLIPNRNKKVRQTKKGGWSVR